MFFEGDIQSGIALAIRQAKQVVCFIQDDGSVSKTWEQELLPHEDVAPVLREKAVLLRIQAGSQEAGFLSAFCPIDKTPALVIIDAGRLREHITGDVTRSQFISRLRAALGAEQISTSEVTQAATLKPAPAREPTSAGEAVITTPATPPVAQVPSEPTPTTKDKGKGKASKTPEPASSSVKAAELSYAAQQRAKKQEALQEKARILAKIEADKKERRVREEERRALAAAATVEDTPLTDIQTPTSTSTSATRKARSGVPGQCKLQVRFFDGTSLRTTFSTTATLRKDVREWIDKGDEQEPRKVQQPPYTFKHHEPPLPARTLGDADEEKTLEELGLTPSATLVLVPVENYSSAYPGRKFGQGGANGIFGLLFGIISGFEFILRAFLGMITGQFAKPGVPEDASASTARQEQLSKDSELDKGQGSSKEAAGIKVRTLADQREEEQRKKKDQEWYNGNQVNLEPKKDDDSPK